MPASAQQERVQAGWKGGVGIAVALWGEGDGIASIHSSATEAPYRLGQLP